MKMRKKGIHFYRLRVAMLVHVSDGFESLLSMCDGVLHPAHATNSLAANLPCVLLPCI